MRLVGITQICFLGNESGGGKKGLDAFWQDAVLLYCRERDPLDADLFFIMFGAGSKSVVGLKAAMKDALDLMEVGMAGAKLMVPADVLADIGEGSDFDRDADFFLSFACKALVEGFAVVLPASREDVKGAAGITHFNKKEFVILNNKGACGSANMGHW